MKTTYASTPMPGDMHVTNTGGLTVWVGFVADENYSFPHWKVGAGEIVMVVGTAGIHAPHYCYVVHSRTGRCGYVDVMDMGWMTKHSKQC